MSELAELLAWAKAIAGLLMLLLAMVSGLGLGILTRLRRLEADVVPASIEIAAWLRGVRAVRRVKATRRAQRQSSSRPDG